jgi:hypothetical protein
MVGMVVMDVIAVLNELEWHMNELFDVKVVQHVHKTLINPLIILWHI